VHVSKGSGASDGNDGKTWGTAKATIAGALAALPQVAGSPVGKVQLGYGTFTVTSYSRATDTGGFTNGSATVTDPSIVATDAGAYVGNCGYIPGNANTAAPAPVVIGNVVAGVSFQMQTPAGVPVNALGTGSTGFSIDKPAIRIPVGVTLAGIGLPAASSAIQSTGYGTEVPLTTIVDTGTGITTWAYTPSSSAFYQAFGFGIRDLVIQGNATSTIGIAMNNINQLRVTNVRVESCGQWGIVAGAGPAVTAVEFDNVTCWKNGSASSYNPTGGLWIAGALQNVFTNVWCDKNIGAGMYVMGGAIGNTFEGCSFTDTTTSGWGRSGAGIVYGADYYGNAVAAVNSLYGCWFESNATYNLYVLPNGGVLNINGSRFVGQGTATNHIFANNPGSITGLTTVNLDRCSFDTVTSGVSILNSAAAGLIVFNWGGCVDLNATFMAGYPNPSTSNLDNWAARLDILTNPPLVVVAGTWTITADYQALNAAYRTNTTNAQNDGAEWAVLVSAGTWKLNAAGVTGPSDAIATFDTSFNGGATWTAVGTWDTYAASTNNLATYSSATFTVPQTGKALVRVRALTRNASATGWYLQLSSMALQRTA
jgi:hypothetical protein